MDGERGCAVPWSQQDGLNLEPGGLAEPGCHWGLYGTWHGHNPGRWQGDVSPNHGPAPRCCVPRAAPRPLKPGSSWWPRVPCALCATGCPGSGGCPHAATAGGHHTG